MSAETLASELEALVPVDNVAAAADNFAGAWEAYFYDALCGTFPVNPGTLSGATSAMVAAMTPTMQTAGWAAIQAGIVAFWGVVSASAAVIWTAVPPLVSATPPPGLSTIAATLQPVGAANQAAELSLADSCSAIASALHPLNLGGTGLNTTGGALPIT